jgi:dsRNA-specific ribonuclease
MKILAEGSARNKRDAKHEAANELLKIMEAEGEANETIL